MHDGLSTYTVKLLTRSKGWSVSWCLSELSTFITKVASWFPFLSQQIGSKKILCY